MTKFHANFNLSFQFDLDKEIPIVSKNDQAIELHGILLADDRIDNLDELESCLMDGIMLFRYSTNWSLVELQERLSRALSKVSPYSLRLCGWMFHGNSDSFALATEAQMDLSDRQNATQWDPVINMIKELDPFLHPNHRRIDLLGCSLTNNPDFETLIHLLQTTNNLTVCTSDDITGNAPGADWDLEDGNIALLGTYLRPDTNKLLANKIIELSTIKTGTPHVLGFNIHRQIKDKLNVDRDAAWLQSCLKDVGNGLKLITNFSTVEMKFLSDTCILIDKYCTNINLARQLIRVNQRWQSELYPSFLPSGLFSIYDKDFLKINGHLKYNPLFFQRIKGCFEGLKSSYKAPNGSFYGVFAPMLCQPIVLK